MAELRSNIMFHGCHFVRNLSICNQICIKHLQVMSGVISSNIKEKRRLCIKPFSWGPQTRHTHTHRQTDRHTHRHDDSISRNSMRCISPKNTSTYRMRKVKCKYINQRIMRLNIWCNSNVIPVCDLLLYICKSNEVLDVLQWNWKLRSRQT